jgi:hypothetical protein
MDMHKMLMLQRCHSLPEAEIHARDPVWELLLGWIGISVREEITEDNIPDICELLQLLWVV